MGVSGQGARTTEIPDKVRAASPETYIWQNAAPALIQHGSRDPIVPVQQSIEFAGKLKQVIGEGNVVLELLDNAEHGDALFETQKKVSRVLDFLDQYMRPGRAHS